MIAAPDSVFDGIARNVLDAFDRFHAANPHVFELFKQFARQKRGQGCERFGAKAVMERIRWELDVGTTDEQFKINNNYASCYARLLIQEDPTFAAFFQLRRSPGTVPLLQGTP